MYINKAVLCKAEVTRYYHCEAYSQLVLGPKLCYRCEANPQLQYECEAHSHLNYQCEAHSH